MDEWNELGPGMKLDRRAFEWGLLSMLIGGCFLIMSPIMLTFTMLYWVQAVRFHTRFEMDLIRIATVVIGLAFLALIAFGAFAAFRGLGLARASKQPAALPLGGLLVCLLDLVLWVGEAVCLMAVLGMFM